MKRLCQLLNEQRDAIAVLDDLIDGFAGEARIASERLGSFRMGCESAAVMRDLPIGSAAPTNPLESVAVP